ncbi:putative lipoprotein [Leptospira yanagawae serovar Saopaulo str. Sao Paulo = ATCC 700523]|uniref:Putative lipoprotein n=1 Tax=Leptospira yanagawae serovar Saopaulo str. Sao Paulo = ATCC 700523 TaxID=1249483 RepID=A0A5E8HER9_9LEPT|nr:hypothetical protein [Leptospira yanagawae]EOQ88486.1 putative lipoprotein [Leptospira yanagawae serovar Saopaulo str. Sao Paulo = ATCC 700523]
MKRIPQTLLFCLLFCACAGGNIKIKIKPDLSGDLLIYQKTITKKPKGSFLGSGIKDKGEVVITLKERSYQFGNFTQMLPPGFRFIEFRDEENKEIQLAIDTSKNSPLLKALEINPEEISSILAEAKLRDDLLRFNTLVEFIQFEIQFPYSIKEVKFFEPRTAGEWTVRLDSKDKMVVNIPLHSIWAGEHALTIVQIYPE